MPVGCSQVGWVGRGLRGLRDSIETPEQSSSISCDYYKCMAYSTAGINQCYTAHKPEGSAKREVATRALTETGNYRK